MTYENNVLIAMFFSFVVVLLLLFRVFIIGQRNKIKEHDKECKEQFQT